MIRLLILSFALGCAFLQTRPALPALAWLWLLPPLLLGAAWLPADGWPGRGRRALALALAGLMGFFYAAGRAELRLAEHLDARWEGRDVSLTGRVLDLPEPTPRGVRFSFAIEAAGAPGTGLPDRVQLTYPAPAGEVIVPPRGGDCLTLTARLFRPHGQVNPHGFDYEAWLLERGIRATGYLRGAPRPAAGCGGAGRAWLDRTREAIRGRLDRQLAGQPHAGVVVALAIGDQNAISSAQWTLFRHTGVTHLMSISGLHVTLFSALMYGLARWLWRRSARLCLWLPAPKAGLAVGLAAAAAYVALAGFGIPAQRTLYMLAGVAAVLWLGLLTSPGRMLAAALLPVMLIDPWAALAPGFWLSFGAVAALFHAAGRSARPRARPAPWRVWLHTQWVVSLALLPLLLALFHEVSLVSPLANAFAIPLVSLVAVPLSLLAAVSPWDLPAQLAHGVLAVTLGALEWLDALPQPVWHVAHPGLPALVLALAGAALVLWPGGRPWRWLGLLLYLPLLLPTPERPPPGEFRLTVLDVGQGLAAVARTAGHTLVFDAGPAYASGEDAGGRIVAPYLHALGVGRVDALIVSHDDLDHSGGVPGLTAGVPVARLVSSLAGLPPERLSPRGRGLLAAFPGAAPCTAGAGWTWDGVEFRLLHPPAHHYTNPNYSDNDRGCVLRVAGRAGSVLIPADIERLGEMNLLERLPGGLRADVLIAPHHGSGTSSSPAFLAAAAPRAVIVPVGHRNRYGHPTPEVLARYRRAGLPVWRTDRHGALEVAFTASGPQVRSERQVSPRYWREDGGGAALRSGRE